MAAISLREIVGVPLRGNANDRQKLAEAFYLFCTADMVVS